MWRNAVGSSRQMLSVALFLSLIVSFSSAANPSSASLDGLSLGDVSIFSFPAWGSALLLNVEHHTLIGNNNNKLAHCSWHNLSPVILEAVNLLIRLISKSP